MASSDRRPKISCLRSRFENMRVLVGSVLVAFGGPGIELGRRGPSVGSRQGVALTLVRHGPALVDLAGGTLVARHRALGLRLAPGRAARGGEGGPGRFGAALQPPVVVI